MSIYGIGNYSAYSSLFSGMYSGSSNKTNSTDLQALMKKADEVRSPEYAKKMKQSYESALKGETEIGSVDAETNLAGSADGLKKSASSLFSISNADIADKDTLLKKVSDFADKYNATIDAMGKSNSVDALRAGLQMTNTVKSYAGALNRIGIKVGSDNKLTVNEDSLKKADNGSVASVLTNTYSPVARVADKAGDVSKAAANKAQTKALTDMLYGNQSASKNSYSGYNNFATSFIGTFFDSYM